jgi:hypothetical protein
MADTAKYTPGPWRIHRNSSTTVEAPFIRNTVASCGSWGNNQRDVLPEQEANARLVSCAPEMAEMLSDALRWLKGVHDIYGAEALGESKPMNCAGLNEMRDVLKKAGVL